MGNRFFEPGDEWVEDASGRGVDVMFRAPSWIEDCLAAVLDRHEASLGHTTCLWHGVRTARVLYDGRGFMADLASRAGGELAALLDGLDALLRAEGLLTP